MVDPDWLRELEQRIDAPPARARVPLRLGMAGTALIGSVESDLARVLAGAGLPIEDAGDAWRLGPGRFETVDAMLEAVARTLRDRQLAGTWRDELLAVTDEHGVGHGTIERAAVRPLGIATHAVHLIAQRSDGGVWVQLRASTKSTDPGLWDTTMGGLIAAGESKAEAVRRETWEEAGLRPAALHELRPFGRFTVRRPLPHGYMVEHTELYEAVVGDAAVPANQDGEVERFECLDGRALVDRLHAGAFTLEAAFALATWLQRPGRGRP